MEQEPLPPPPASQEENRVRRREIHLPGTNFFRSFRLQIAAYETSPHFKEGFEPVLAAAGAFVVSAFFTLFISLGQVSTFSPIFSGDQRWIGSVFLAPPVEETVKGFSVLIMSLLIARAVPNRRYAVSMGLAAGLGYALSEDITYFANPDVQPQNMALRLLTNPIGHPLYTAICAIGVFVFVMRLRSGLSIFKAIYGLPLLMWLLAVLAHAFWNAWQFGVIPSTGYAGIALSLFVIILPFGIILRDFLGGHFNFGHFFEPIPEPSPPSPPADSEMPPPPMPTEIQTKRNSGKGGWQSLCGKAELVIKKENKNTWLPN